MSYRGLIYTVLLLAATVSCSRDGDGIGTGGAAAGDGKVELTFSINAPDYAAPVSRADEGKIGNTPLVLVFTGGDGNAVFSEAVTSTFDGSNTTVKVSESDVQSMFVVIANPPASFYDRSSSQVITNLSTALSGCKLSELENRLWTVPLTSADIAAGLPYEGSNDLLPMSGVSNPVPKIDENTVIENGNNIMTLTRAVAKVYVAADVSLGGSFVVAGAGCLNAPENGAIYRHGMQIVPAAGVVKYMNSSGSDVKSGAGTAGAPLYLYERTAGFMQDGSLPLVIVKAALNGNMYYYKLAFTIDGNLLNIERNMEYTFVLKEAVRGYTSIDEAIAGPVSNILYEIKVVDATAHDIIGNGQYYLGLSNTEVFNYGNRTSFAQAFVVTTDYNPDWGSEYITLTPSAGITITSPTNNRIAISSSGETSATVNFTVTALTYYGTIKVKIGNLEQTITFQRRTFLPFSGFGALPHTDYVQWEIPAGTGEWLKVKGTDNVRVNKDMTLWTAQRIYIDADNYVTDNGTRDAVFFVSRKSGGRAKVYVTQQGIDLNTVSHTTPKYGYVGAFWRASQTGERLIKMPYEDDIIGDWTATVVDGEEWIKIDMQPSADTGVTWDVEAENPADMILYDYRYQVPGNGTSAGGTVEEPEDEIFFRIGLRSTIPEGSQPRYGRILVSYNVYQQSNGAMHTKYYFIYIRQGEADDYLYRPEDPNGAGNGWGDGVTHRPYAVKISPFNLTAQQYRDNHRHVTTANARTVASHPQVDKGVFVDYPTQAGAFFNYASLVNKKRAWHPVLPGGESTAYFNNSQWPSSTPSDYLMNQRWPEFKDEHESCPTGYRRMKDHYDENVGETPSASLTAIVNSEARQSMFVNPPSGFGQQGNSTGNFYFYVGLYADGFYDRRAIVKSETNYSPTYAVATDGAHVAYKGTLLCNRFNNAAVFFPQAGYRGSGGTLSNSGVMGRYWLASTPAGTSQGWHFSNTSNHNYLPRGTVQYQASTRFYGYPIRCVVDE